MTHNHPFAYRELLTFGWEKTKAHFPFLLSLVVGAFVIGLITGGVPIVGDIIAGLVTIAMISILLMIVDGHTPQYRDLLKPFQTYYVTLHYFIALILYVLAVIAGLILLILPGIYVAVRLQFFSYLVVDHGHMKGIDALKKSWEMTQGKFWKLFGWSIVLFFINLLGLLALGVGLLFTIPVTAVAYTKLYRTLASPAAHHHETPEEVPPTKTDHIA
jgi:uncharacterized membrane protein